MKLRPITFVLLGTGIGEEVVNVVVPIYGSGTVIRVLICWKNRVVTGSV